MGRGRVELGCRARVRVKVRLRVSDRVRVRCIRCADSDRPPNMTHADSLMALPTCFLESTLRCPVSSITAPLVLQRETFTTTTTDSDTSENSKRTQLQLNVNKSRKP